MVSIAWRRRMDRSFGDRGVGVVRDAVPARRRRRLQLQRGGRGPVRPANRRASRRPVSTGQRPRGDVQATTVPLDRAGDRPPARNREGYGVQPAAARGALRRRRRITDSSIYILNIWTARGGLCRPGPARILSVCQPGTLWTRGYDADLLRDPGAGELSLVAACPPRAGCARAPPRPSGLAMAVRAGAGSGSAGQGSGRRAYPAAVNRDFHRDQPLLAA